MESVLKQRRKSPRQFGRTRLSQTLLACGIGVFLAGVVTKQGLAEQGGSLSEDQVLALIDKLSSPSVEKPEKANTKDVLETLFKSTATQKPAYIAGLRKAAISKDLDSAMMAMHLLWLFQNSEARSVLGSVAVDKQRGWQERSVAINAYGTHLRKWGTSSEALSLLRSLIGDSDCILRARAASALASVGQQDIEPLLTEMAAIPAEDRNKLSCQLEAITGLGWLDSQSSKALLSELLKHKTDFVRAQAIDALNEREYRTEQTIPGRMKILERELGDTSWGPQGQWARGKLLAIIRGDIAGDRSKALEILKAAARDRSHPMHRDIHSMLTGFCQQSKEYCF
jgi:HEAT repeat protein